MISVGTLDPVFQVYIEMYAEDVDNDFTFSEWLCDKKIEIVMHRDPFYVVEYIIISEEEYAKMAMRYA